MPQTREKKICPQTVKMSEQLGGVHSYPWTGNCMT